MAETDAPLSAEERREALALVNAVTPGRWHISDVEKSLVSNYDGKTGGVVADCATDADAAFIAAAPALVRRYEATGAEAQRERDEALAKMKLLEPYAILHAIRAGDVAEVKQPGGDDDGG